MAGLQFYRDTAANLTSNNPTLEAGRPGYETDTGKLKIGDGSTAWTSLDYFVEGQVLGKEHLWVPAGAMISRTSSGAEAVSTELETNDVMLETMNFDSASDEFAQFSLQMPAAWDEGTLIAQFVWSHPSTATNFGVTWAIQAVAFANDDPLDTAFGTAITVNDTGGTTNDLYISPESSAITVAGSPGAEEVVYFQVYRDVSDANDDLAVDARLHGVKIHWTKAALNND